MSLAHETHTHQEHGVVGSALPLFLLLVVVVAYLILACARSTEPRGWNRWRTTSFLVGAVFLALGLMPQISPYPVGSLPSHMYQHLLIGMYAPIGLVLGAPMTLLLRSLPRRHGKRVGRILRSGPLHVVAHPISALVLSLGGLAALYFTPLYETASRAPVLHGIIHVHFLAAGYLFAWVIAGPDPAPNRPSVPVRLVVLGVAITGHAVISQLLYAGVFVQVSATTPELRQAGELMYYAGDIAELILAFALVTSWRPARKTGIEPTAGKSRPGTVL